MKLVIQLPCYEEAGQLPATLAGLPRRVDGIDEVMWLVVDDGSRDGTAHVAAAGGADKVVRLKRHRGLAATFQAGMDAALQAGADIVVTIDGDGQFDGRDIPRLVQPLLDGDADVTIGDRDVRQVAYFSWSKRLLQRLGSAVVRRASGTQVCDTTSGFRAYDREAALSTEVFCGFTYTLDTLIRAGRNGLAVRDVAVATEPASRPSRLYTSVWTYLRRAIVSIYRSHARYAPKSLFLPASAAVLLLAAGILSAARGLPGVVSAAVVAVLTAQLATVGLIAWLASESSRLTDATLVRVRRIELAGDNPVNGVLVAHQPTVDCDLADGREDPSPPDFGPRAPSDTAELSHQAR